MNRFDADRQPRAEASTFRANLRSPEFLQATEFTATEARRVAIESVITASLEVLSYWPSPTNPNYNKERALMILDEKEGTGNFATLADLAAESIITTAIRRNFFLHSTDIISEESVKERRPDSPWQWHIDPLDGTLNFTNGLPFFSISMGLLYNGEPMVGVIANPVEQRIIAAQKGKSAQLLSFNGESLLDLRELTERPKLPLRQSVIGHDVGYTGREEQIRRIDLRLASQVGSLVSYYSTVYAGGLVAQRLLSGYLFAAPKSYDIAAHGTILPESGCVVSDIYGNPINFSDPKTGFLAARDEETLRALVEPQAT